MQSEREQESAHPLMGVGSINMRIDQVLRYNRREELQMIAMATAIFLVGVVLLAMGYSQRLPYLSAGSIPLHLLLYGPIRKIDRIRRENIVLQVFPILIATLTAEAAEQEMRDLLAYIRGGRNTEASRRYRRGSK